MKSLYVLLPALSAVLLALPVSAQVHADGVLDPTTAPALSRVASSVGLDDLVQAKTGAMAHVDRVLVDLYAGTQAPAARRALRSAADSYVTVDAIAETQADADALEASLAGMGFQLSARLGAILSGNLPISAIGDAAELANLQALVAPQYILHRRDGDVAAPLVHSGGLIGSVTGEASQALRVADARDAFGVDGSNICIGTLSDSYSVSGDGGAAAIASGDLPDDVLVILQPESGSDEGRAMIELARDVAPGADFAFHTAFGGNATFANGIIRLFNAGCRVIVDDVSNSFEPMFQDGIIAQAVDIVVGAGASYFSSAGNSANASYEGDYAGIGVPLIIRSEGDEGESIELDSGELHDFDPGPGVDAFQDVTLFPGERLRFTFGYDEPSAIAEGFPGVARDQQTLSDYDVFVLNTPSPVVVDSLNLLDFSVRNNISTDLPVEFIEYTNTTGTTQTVYVAITRFAGETNNRLKYINFGGTRQVIEEAEYAGSSTTFGHSNAAGAFATGAAPWFNTAAFNGFVAANQDAFGPAVVESFTSYGGLEVRLDVNGNRIDPDDRMKPDAVASDGDNNTFFGSDSSVDADTNPNFFGTSAAAPNLAGVAALMIEAAGGVGEVSPTEVYAALENTAADLLIEPGAERFNLGAGPGYDRQTGNGFIIGDAAIAAVAANACSGESLLAFGDFDADGDDAEFGEFAALQNNGGATRLAGCTFATFDPLTELVTYATATTGSISTEGSYVFATMNGNQMIPEMTIPDGPGAFVLVAGEVEVGDDVLTVLTETDIVAAVVYSSEDDVFASVGGTGSAATNRQALINALSQLANPVADEGEAAAVDLAVVAAPNPVSGRGTVSFGVAEGGDVRVALYDALGREVAQLADAAYGAGRHTVDVPVADLPAGVYVVRVQTEDAAHTARLTVVR